MRDELVNIGSKQRKTRAFLGVVTLSTAGVAGLRTGISLSIGLLFLFWALAFSGVMLVLEAIYGVCPVNAIRNKISMEGCFSIGQQDIKDQKRAEKIKKVAFKEVWQSAVIALLATGGLLLIK